MFKTCLGLLASKYVPFFFYRPRLKLSEVGMFKTCLGLLAAMLADNIEIGGELHIERLYLFCLIWTFGGLLDAADRKAFSDLLKELSTAYDI